MNELCKSSKYISIILQKTNTEDISEGRPFQLQITNL